MEPIPEMLFLAERHIQQTNIIKLSSRRKDMGPIPDKFLLDRPAYSKNFRQLKWNSYELEYELVH